MYQVLVDLGFRGGAFSVPGRIWSRTQSVVSQLIVIVQFLIAQSNPHDPLGQKAEKGVLPPLRNPMIGEIPGQTAGHIQHATGLAQKPRTTIR